MQTRARRPGSARGARPAIQGLAAVAAAALLACVPGAGPCVLPAVHGRVVIDETGAPVAGAVVFERWLGTTAFGTDAPTRYARFARTGTDGRFAFDRAFAPAPGLWARRCGGPVYGFAHPDRGLVHAGAGPGESGDLVLRTREADAAARLGDLRQLCQTASREDWERELAAAVCAPRPPRPVREP